MGVGVGVGAVRADAGAFARRIRSSSAHHRYGGPWSWRVLTTGLLIAAVSMLVVSTVVDSSSHRLALDFRGAYLPAAHAVLDGQSPYTAPGDPVGGYVYPPQLALLLTPLTFVPEGVAVLFAVLVVSGLLVGSLAVLGVRDIRCYAAVFVWAPTWNELDMASVTAGLVFALALAWRYREQCMGRRRSLSGSRFRRSSFSGRYSSGRSPRDAIAPRFCRSRSASSSRSLHGRRSDSTGSWATWTCFGG